MTAHTSACKYAIGLLPSMTFASLTADSRVATSDSLFLAYKGALSDGRHFIDEAIANGAKAILWDEADGFSWREDWPIKHVAVTNLKQQAGVIAAEFYGNPSASLTMIGVTGTNGKTSVTQWIGQCLSRLGQKTAVIGTNGHAIFEAHQTPPNTSNAAPKSKGVCENPLSISHQQATMNTTPDAILIQKILAEYLALGVQAVAMEVSSHGLDQGRVNGIAFDVGVLTNLTRDHLDYHGNMENYAAAKQTLFVWPNLKTAILNGDDDFGQSLVATLSKQQRTFATYGFNESDFHADHLVLSQHGLQMTVSTLAGTAKVNAPVIGRFNADNILAVLATLVRLDFNLHDAVTAISHITPVPGRMQQIGGGSAPLVVVDYAHTPDALEKILVTLKAQLSTHAKLICVFGCGGNRDAGKRPIMGNIASQYADVIVLTNDNPRHEVASDILQAIQAGFNVGFDAFNMVPDRKEAIFSAVSQATIGDIVIIAGKGHEDYQDIAGVKTPFSDIAIAQASLDLKAPVYAGLNGFSQTPSVHAIKGRLQ